ncbi:hypothetical protein HED60_06845 [Planctomycetales bacterium ZRK34]|nr:hypothetical protein HED60_06845 [Planctomycetales bacterium ZRK34]
MIQVKDHAHWPIGCDIQGDSVRIAQVSSASGNLKKLEAACARLQDCNAAAETIAKLVQEGSFHGNEIVLPCPATLLQYRALQIVSMPAAELKYAAHWQFCRELELDPDKTISIFS